MKTKNKKSLNLHKVYGQLGGRKGGLATSRAKRLAAKRNGKLGGRPRKK